MSQGGGKGASEQDRGCAGKWFGRAACEGVPRPCEEAACWIHKLAECSEFCVLKHF